MLVIPLSLSIPDDIKSALSAQAEAGHKALVEGLAEAGALKSRVRTTFYTDHTNNGRVRYELRAATKDVDLALGELPERSLWGLCRLLGALHDAGEFDVALYDEDSKKCLQSVPVVTNDKSVKVFMLSMP